MRILGFGTYEADRHPRVAVLLDGLREHGDDVTELNVPLHINTAERVAMLARPWRAYRLIARLLSCWFKLITRSRAVRRSGPFDLILVGYLGQFDVVLARLLFPRTRIALDQLIFAADTAADRGVTRGARLQLLRLLDWAAMTCANIVIVDTEEHRDLLPRKAQRKGVVVPVGVATKWLSAPPSTPASAQPLRVIFFGLYTPLQGAPSIGAALAALAARPDIEVTMIGAGQDLPTAREAAAANTSVNWRDWVAPDELPGIVGAHDVCLGIFGTTPKAHRVVPNKVYQGAAAACALVTADTAPQRRALGDAAIYVPPGDAQALAMELCALADDRHRAATLGHAARELAELRFTPARVVVPLRDLVRRQAVAQTS